jgi:hypothetical protein
LALVKKPKETPVAERQQDLLFRPDPLPAIREELRLLLELLK